MSENNDKKKYLVTAGLPYSNGRLHVGHLAGAYLPADIFCRYKRLCGDDVRFVCGSDDHGVPIKLTADKEGKEPRVVAEHFNKNQAKDFKSINIDFDIYSSTSGCPHHYKTSQDFFKKLYDQGYFTKYSKVVFSEDEAKKLNLKIDKDDSLCFEDKPFLS